MTFTPFSRSHKGLDFGKWPPLTTHTHTHTKKQKRDIIDTTFFKDGSVQTGGGHTFSSENTVLVFYPVNIIIIITFILLPDY